LREHLAKFAGLSRVTINQSENGTLNDLGYNKLKAVRDIVGIDMEGGRLREALSSRGRNRLRGAAEPDYARLRD
jgi:transcriptional regulator with XRE-family HTH domain